jgi:multimeric flavodoxin WrbA
MRILGIMGSPRKGGNTEILLGVALEEAQKKGAIVSEVSLRDKTIAPCNGCLKCTKTGKCVIKDDMQEIYGEMIESDAIIWATPVYFWSMTSLTKIVMDRTYSLLFPKLQLANKVGGVILVAATRGCVNAANIFHMYFSYNHMFFAEFSWGYAREKAEIKQDEFAQNMVKEMTHQVVSLLQANLKFPEEFSMPLYRHVTDKYLQKRL